MYIHSYEQLYLKHRSAGTQKLLYDLISKAQLRPRSYYYNHCSLLENNLLAIRLARYGLPSPTANNSFKSILKIKEILSRLENKCGALNNVLIVLLYISW